MIFGRRVADWDTTLRTISDAGFTGVELFQPPSQLAPNCRDLLKRLDSFGLELLGLSGGALAERAEFLDSHKAPYLYADRFGAEERRFLEAGYRIALHPHLLKDIHRLSDAVEHLRNPDLKPHWSRLQLIPDTAHLTIVGDDILDALQRYRDQIAVLHLKDWDSCYGRASHRASRGFTVLGKGVTPIRKALDLLASPTYLKDLWVVVEQDFAERSPLLDVYDAARQLMQWKHLQSRGFQYLRDAELLSDTKPLVQDQKSPRRPLPGRSQAHRVAEDEIELAYRRELDRLASKGTGTTAYDAILPLRRLLESVSAICVQAYREGAKSLTVLASVPEINSAAQGIVQLLAPSPTAESLISAERAIESPLAAQSNQRMPWEIGVPQRYRRYRIPICDTFNINHLRFIVDFYAPVQWRHAELCWKLCTILGQHMDTVLDRKCQRFAGSVSKVAAENSRFAEFATGLRGLIAEAIECEAVAIFVADSSRSILNAVGSDDVLEWKDSLSPNQRVYRKDDQTDTADTWVRSHPLFRDPAFHPEQRKNAWKSKLKLTIRETGTDNMQRVQILHFPILDSKGECIGIVRCGGKFPPVRFFYEDDLAILDAILHIATPRLLSLRAEDALYEQQGHVTHELKRPTIAIRAAMDLIDAQFKARVERLGVPMLDYPWIDDVKTWCDLMSSIVSNPDYMRAKLPLKVEPVWMLSDVVAPIVRMMTATLRDPRQPRPYRQDENGKTVPSILYGAFEHFDRKLYLDRNKFQQVIFNLLDNAIKYSKPNKPEQFRVEFQTAFRQGAFIIRVRDWGIGIDSVLKNPEVIFEEGVRGPRAFMYQLAGTGFGLWLTRRLLELHHCSIEVTNRAEPTEFTITIPSTLTRENWIADLGGQKLE